MSELFSRRRWRFRTGKLVLAPFSSTPFSSNPTIKFTLLLNTALLAMFFVAWCCLDYSLVQSPQFPRNSADDDWLFIFVPIVTLATNLIVHRRQGLRKSLFVAIIASVALSVLLLVVVVVFGIPFHVSIGGSL
jgi:hypothetical protein